MKPMMGCFSASRARVLVNWTKNLFLREGAVPLQNDDFISSDEVATTRVDTSTDVSATAGIASHGQLKCCFGVILVVITLAQAGAIFFDEIRTRYPPLRPVGYLACIKLLQQSAERDQTTLSQALPGRKYQRRIHLS